MASIAQQCNTLTGSFCIADTSGTVVYANTAVRDRSGFDVGEIVGKKPGAVWGGNMSPVFYRSMWQELSQEKRPLVRDVINTTKQGKKFLDRVHIAPLLSDKGEVQYYMEMHPLGLDHEKEKFQNDFFSVFEKSHVLSKTVVSLFSKWFAPNSSLESTKGSFVTDIFDVFIPFIHEQFADRYDDAGLIQEAKKNPAQFGLLYEKYMPLIQSYMRQRTSTHDKAEELAHEVFLKALKALPTFEYKQASYKTYLYRIAHNVLVNHYRDQKETEDIADHAGAMKSVDTSVVVNAKMMIAQAFESLTPLERQIMSMKYLKGMKGKEIANELDKSENAVKLHTSRARRKMREVIEDL